MLCIGIQDRWLWRPRHDINIILLWCLVLTFSWGNVNPNLQTITILQLNHHTVNTFFACLTIKLGINIWMQVWEQDTGIHREITYVIISLILITINRLIWLDNGQKSVHVITQDKNHIPWNKTHIPTPRSYRCSLTGKRQRHSERITCCGCGF